MPHIIESDDAAERMVSAIARQETESHFPKKLTMWFKLIGLLPKTLQINLIKRKFAK